MSKIQSEIQSTINQLKALADNPLAASHYSIGQVISLLNDVAERAGGPASDPAGIQVSGTSTHTHVTLSPRVQKIGITEEQLDDLYENLREHITAVADDLSGDDVIDRDSLEVSISGQYASIENVSIDSCTISDAINEDIETVINDWIKKNDITLLPNE